jgi:DNA-binding transcriptional LysR family regulator
MFINDINLNHLRIFEAVYRTRNMTNASRELHLTQSGVSQHIKSLEESLGFRLFDRLKKKILPTPEAEILYRKCSEGFVAIEQAITSLKGGKISLAGNVAIGMPPEFGTNIVLPKLAEYGKEHPEMNFQAIYGFASEMNSLLLEGEVDFAFVDAVDLDPQIATEEVSHETLYLCASKAYLKAKHWRSEEREQFEKLDYVTYSKGEAILEMWFGSQFHWKRPRLNIRASVRDVQGVARLIVADFGVGILPGHLAKRLENQGHELHRFKGSGRGLQNAISLAYLKGRTLSPPARALFEQFKKTFEQNA